MPGRPRSARPSRGSAGSFGALIGVATFMFCAGGVLTSSAASPSTPSTFVPTAPCRLFDTRSGSDNVGPRSTPVASGETLEVQVRGTNGKCTIPASATGVSMNVAVVNGTASSFLTVFPPDETRPLASSLNWVGGQAPTPNAVTAKLSANGRLGFYNLSGNVDLAVDVVGYYEAAASGGAPGPVGPAGATGATGATGTTGATGARGVSAWDTIPSGQTVIGSATWTTPKANGATYGQSISLPALAPVDLTGATVGFGPGGLAVEDPSCTGTTSAPTAPPGHFCAYVSLFNVNFDPAIQPLILAKTGVSIVWTTNTGGSGVFQTSTISVSWAYTAP